MWDTYYVQILRRPSTAVRPVTSAPEDGTDGTVRSTAGTAAGRPSRPVRTRRRNGRGGEEHCWHSGRQQRQSEKRSHSLSPKRTTHRIKQTSNTTEEIETQQTSEFAAQLVRRSIKSTKPPLGLFSTVFASDHLRATQPISSTLRPQIPHTQPPRGCAIDYQATKYS